MTTKLHLLISSGFQVIEEVLSGGNTHDVCFADQLTENIYGCAVLADKSYDSDPYRQRLFSRNNKPVIPGREGRKTPIVYDKKLYKARRNIELLFGRIKEQKREAFGGSF
ncbi:MAG: transposase [Vampirovibrio sp.]